MHKRSLFAAFGKDPNCLSETKKRSLGFMQDSKDVLFNTVFSPICGGAYHSLVMDTSGSLWSWGNNQYGQLGFLTKKSFHNKPTKLQIAATITKISCGAYHTSAIDIYGNLWLWGRNTHHQVLEQNIVNVPFPTKLSISISVSYVACGYAHTMALDKNNNLWAWGSNENGQIGTGENNSIQQTPVNISNDTNFGNIYFIACGYYHSVVINEEGSVYSWGNNEHGQLGVGSLEDVRVPHKISSPLPPITNISCGAYHVIAVDNQSLLWCWGWNSLGQLGLDHKIDQLSPVSLENIFKKNVISVSCGYSHSVVVIDDGSMWGWGYNENGELGMNDIDASAIPKQIFGVDVTQYVTCGGNHTICVDDKGKLWCFGWNEDGQLGTKNWDDYYSPVSIDSDITALNRNLIRGRRTKPSHSRLKR